MNCEEVERREIAEQYVSGQLDDVERDAYEVHFFECVACLDHLQLLQAIQPSDRSSVVVMPRRPAFYSRLRWLPAAAILVVLGGIAWWDLRRIGSPVEPIKQAQGPVAAAPVVAVPPKPTPDSKYDQLARVDAPQYREPRMRGTTDTADTQFRAAMRHYQQKDYAGAIPGLTEAARLNPKSSSIQFFLGVTHLLNGDRAEAIAPLRVAAAMEDSLEAGDAHFYLGKALVGEHDTEGAIAEFKKAIAAQSERGPEASRIIDALRGAR